MGAEAGVRVSLGVADPSVLTRAGTTHLVVYLDTVTCGSWEDMVDGLID